MDYGTFKGLCESEVNLSREKYGRNILSKRKRKGFVRNLFSNFGDPMIRVLLIALVINSVFLLGKSNWFESLGIAAAVFIAVLVSTVSEHKSETAFEKLRESVESLTCLVRRNGQTRSIPVFDIVCGDIIILGAGDKICADGRIISGALEVDQSALNGESKQAKKSAATNAAARTDGFLDSRLLFSGTVVTAGEGVMIAEKVGDNTFYGRLAAEVQQTTPDSPLKQKLERLAKKISLYGYLGAALVVLSYLFNALIITNSFDGALILAAVRDYRMLLSHVLNAAALAVTVIVMAVPEGLPMMITVVLSANMRRMLKDNVLVRKLNGIETAGSMNILFTDKTGTLTAGKPEVISIVDGAGTIYSRDEFYKSKDALKDLLSLSLRHNTAAQIAEGVAAGGNATDRVLLDFCQKLPLPKMRVIRGAAIGFSSSTKFMAQKISGDKNLTLIKGAPEKILEYCDSCFNARGAAVSIDKRAVQARLTELSGKAVRIVAVAVSDKDIVNNRFERLTLVCLVGIRDQIRPEAAKAVRQIQSAGIQTVMITGDSKATAVAIAKETGIITSDTDLVLTSEELSKLTDQQLKQKLKRLRVVARALPSDKSRLVRAAQSLQLVAGMTGDGVNDAPALKLADIGFAMGSGTEVAKEAGDVVILDDNILSISRAASYGRTIFKSIRKFIIFQLTINFCAMAVSVIAPLIKVESPITVIQMLWINLVMDTLAGLAFGGEQPRARYMTEPPKTRSEPIINKYMWQQILITSTFAAALSLWFLKSNLIQSLFAGQSPAYTMTAFFTLFMFIAIFNSLNARTHEINLLDYLALNKQFLWIMSAIIAIQILLVYFGGALFRTSPLSARDLFIVLGIAFSVIPLDLIRKAVTRLVGCRDGT